MVIVDFSNTELDGKIAEELLDLVGISTSKSTIPDDPNPPFRPSGLRIGIQAMTTRGVKEKDVETIVNFIDQTLKLVPLIKGDKGVLKTKLAQIHQEVKDFCQKFPI